MPKVMLDVDATDLIKILVSARSGFRGAAENRRRLGVPYGECERLAELTETLSAQLTGGAGDV